MPRGKNRRRQAARQEAAQRELLRAEQQREAAAQARLLERQEQDRARADLLASIAAIEEQVSAATAEPAELLAEEIADLEVALAQFAPAVTAASKRRQAKRVYRLAAMEGYDDTWEFIADVIGEAEERFVFCNQHPARAVLPRSLNATLRRKDRGAL